jgi:Fe-S cluster assembly ATP-binding protein
MLEIKNLYVSYENKLILKGVNLKLESGKVHALMGPNGSGKTTLSYVLMGHPKYKIMQGEILLNGKDIATLSADERAKLGLFLSFQSPVPVSGVTISNFLRQAYNAVNEKKLSLLEFRRLLEDKCKELSVDSRFLNRYLNEGFSGGEKKKAEILQMLVLNPRLAVLDETDSGLDIDALKSVASGINKFMNEDKTVLVITHYRRILDYVKPDKVFVMIDGKIAVEGSGEIINNLEEKGYGWIGEGNSD